MYHCGRRMQVNCLYIFGSKASKGFTSLCEGLVRWWFPLNKESVGAATKKIDKEK